MASSKGFDLSGKVALVTGSNSGIGEAIALTFARCGASVTFTGRDEKRLQASLGKCVEESEGHSERFFSLAGDLTDSSFRTKLVEETVAKFGKLDILVCNAGGESTASGIDETTEQEFDTQVDIYMKSVFFLIQAALPHLEKTKGNVVNVSSMLGSMAIAKGVVYCMIKAAINHMTRCLALDLAPRGIRVNALSPSYIVTLAWRHVIPDEDACRKAMFQFGEKESENQPLGNRLVTLEELADGACFLASDAASFVTGQNLTVDGGRSLTGPIKF